ncbi:hypothetical protein JHK85_011947 [Glycine max]|nr:hypothetical protein JHK85_011947 [Glycine max]KAG5056622.1 hypothetical protein JHK86_011618 [Glycine max]
MGNCCGTRCKVDDTLNSNHSSADVTKVHRRSTHLLVHSNLNGHGYSDEGKPEIILPTPRSEGDILSSPHLKPFTLHDLKKATRNFQLDSLIGEGGFGYVYKGLINDGKSFGPTMPKSGTVVAVKKLKPEVNYLGQLRHPNLVKLIGYCLEGDNRLLVYEYMPNRSLEDHIFRKGTQPLPWATRVKIAIGAAQGLSFLHDSKQQIIYRDFKASNILLDSWSRPYLGDRRKLFRIMDTKLEGQYPQKAAYTIAIIALQCISEAKTRPQMFEVLAALEHLRAIRHSASPSGEEKSMPSPMLKSPLGHNHPEL